MSSPRYNHAVATSATTLVIAIAADLKAARERVTETTRAYDALRAGPPGPQLELNSMHRAVRDAERDAAACFAELDQLGVEVEDVAAGVFGFPSELDGREIVLSWQVGEEQIEYYRAEDEKPGVRHALPVPVHAAD